MRRTVTTTLTKQELVEILRGALPADNAMPDNVTFDFDEMSGYLTFTYEQADRE